MINYTSQLSKDGPLILLFHGVVEKNDYGVRNYIRKHIEVDYFADILRKLSALGPALSMDEIVDIHQSGRDYPENAFAVTFDDGFENNYSVAAPVLSDLKIPSVFYITSDFIENGTMSWTDKAEYCLEEIPKGQIRLPWSNQIISFESDEEKIGLMKLIRQHVFKNDDVNVHEFTDWFFQQLGVTKVQTTDDPLDKKLSWRQIGQLNEDPLFTIGGHTHTHIIMSFVPFDEMEAEVDLNLKLLKDKANIDTNHYAYPQGQHNHYNRDVVNALKNRGIVCCPTAIEGQNTKETGMFDLYRTMVI